MGFWVWDATTDAVKRYSPDATSVKQVWGGTCNLGWSAVDAVKVNGGKMVKVKDHIPIPGPETQEKILWCFNHPLTREVSKLFIPAPACNIWGAALKGTTSGSHPVQNDKKYEQVVEQLKMVQADQEKMRTELERVKGLGSLPPNTTSTTAVPRESPVAQKPEEVISIFMMKGLKVTDLLDNQVVPIRGRVDLEQQRGVGVEQ